MRTEWFSKFSGRKVVVLGFGMEGKSTYRALKQFCPDCQVQIMDRKSGYVRAFFEGKDDLPFIYGDQAYLAPDPDVAWVFKSPGIPLKDLEGHVPMEKVTSQSNEFIQAYRENIVGITGTKGKSTTACFLYDLLKAHEVDVQLVGNIGKPAFDYIEAGDGTPVFVYELSSHQLETAKASPKYGLVLNLFEEHLDHYKSFDHYAEAKMNMGRYQGEDDWLVLGPGLSARAVNFKGRQLPISMAFCDEGLQDLGDGVTVRYGNALTIDDSIERRVIGHHNLVNMATAILLARLLGYEDSSKEIEVMGSFEGIPHRLAYVAEVDGVTYYNDSISTIPQATIAAIKALPEVQTVLIGGMDRGIDYSLLFGYIDERPDLIWLMMPDSGHSIARALGQRSNVLPVADLEQAVIKASELTEKGRICLLSPAAASYGFYKNFEERGRVFENLVRGLS